MVRIFEFNTNSFFNQENENDCDVLLVRSNS